MGALQATALTLAMLGATAVVATRDPLRQIIFSGLYGLVLTCLFMIFQAPDVALSMLVASAIAYPAIVLVAVARVRSRGKGEGE